MEPRRVIEIKVVGTSDMCIGQSEKMDNIFIQNNAPIILDNFLGTSLICSANISEFSGETEKSDSLMFVDVGDSINL